MNLTESQLFTIEALNRIEGFEWPKDAKFAAMDDGRKDVLFYLHKPMRAHTVFTGDFFGLDGITSQSTHPDWCNSLITREQFESVDGWVRNNCIFTKINSLIDVTIKSKGDDYVIDGSCDNWTPEWESGDIVKWRYRKPKKQEVKPESESIETTIAQYKAAKENKLKAQQLLEQAEATESSLMMSIEAWAESHGFDIIDIGE
ncbi:MAG: hypothetical protein ACRDDY_13175 [Clostridium sp.]|uniref:hypothetical protein n=1 Tax=Clostridium sp. TaxID=1506 RepID=UPI003EE778D6